MGNGWSDRKSKSRDIPRSVRSSLWFLCQWNFLIGTDGAVTSGLWFWVFSEVPPPLHGFSAPLSSCYRNHVTASRTNKTLKTKQKQLLLFRDEILASLSWGKTKTRIWNKKLKNCFGKSRRARRWLDVTGGVSKVDGGRGGGGGRVKASPGTACWSSPRVTFSWCLPGWGCRCGSRGSAGRNRWSCPPGSSPRHSARSASCPAHCWPSCP